LSERTHHTATDMMLRLWRHWPGWVGYVAASWSSIYGAVGLWWCWTARITHSQAQTTPKQRRSPSCGAQVGIAGPVIVALGLVGAVVALAMAQGSRGHRILRVALHFFAWSVRRSAPENTGQPRARGRGPRAHLFGRCTLRMVVGELTQHSRASETAIHDIPLDKRRRCRYSRHRLVEVDYKD
jgi:hypothetical protein